MWNDDFEEGDGGAEFVLVSDVSGGWTKLVIHQ